MKIAVDENIPLMTVRTLRDMGQNVRDLRGTADEGISDEELWKIVQRDGRLLITTDKGFVRYRTAEHYGMLIIRLRQPNRHKIHRRVMQAMKRFREKEWPGLIVVMRDAAQSTWRARA